MTSSGYGQSQYAYTIQGTGAHQRVASRQKVVSRGVGSTA